MMEVFWIYAWLVWLSYIPALRWESTPLNLISCLALGVAVEIVVRLTLAGRWSLQKVRLVVIPLSFLLLIILMRLNLGGGYALFDTGWFKFIPQQVTSFIFSGIFGLIIIWRAISTGQQDNSFTSLYHRFVFGLAGIILVLIVWRFGSPDTVSIWQGVGPEILLFFGCGMLALATSNLEKLRMEMRQQQEATASFSRRWISMLIILVAAILVIGVLVVSLLSVDTGADIVNFLGKLGSWLLEGLLYLLYPIGFIAQLLFYVVRFFVNLLRGESTPQFDMLNPNEMPEYVQQGGEGALPAVLVTVLKWLVILAAAGLIIYFLSRLLARNWKGKTEEGVEEVHETLGSWSLFKADMRHILAWLFGWLRRRKPPAVNPPAVYKSPAIEPEVDAQYTIREIYQALLWEARQSGLPRRPDETPYEYYQRFIRQRSLLQSELSDLTEAYVIERYSEINPEAEQVRRLNILWRNLRDKLRESDNPA
jgi:hypothetical protein